MYLPCIAFHQKGVDKIKHIDYTMQKKIIVYYKKNKVSFKFIA